MIERNEELSGLDIFDDSRMPSPRGEDLDFSSNLKVTHHLLIFLVSRLQKRLVTFAEFRDKDLDFGAVKFS